MRGKGYQPFRLKKDPTRWLSRNGSPPVRWWIYRHIMKDDLETCRIASQLPGCSQVRELFSRQLSSGSWGRDNDLTPFEGTRYGSGTILVLDMLSDMGVTMVCSQVEKAVENLFRFRTRDNRFFWKSREVRTGRGEHGCYWGVKYEGYMLKILLRFGVEVKELEPTIERLINGQQEDGYWHMHYNRHNRPVLNSVVDHGIGPRILATTMALTGLLEVNGMDGGTLRKGGDFLLQNLFNYTHGPQAGAQFLTEWYYSMRYPEFNASVLKSLVLIRRIGVRETDPRMAEGLRWLIARQGRDGFWRTRIPPRLVGKYGHLKKNDEWITLNALLALKGF